MLRITDEPKSPTRVAAEVSLFAIGGPTVGLYAGLHVGEPVLGFLGGTYAGGALAMMRRRLAFDRVNNEYSQ
jgi:hypothetical protein